MPTYRRTRTLQAGEARFRVDRTARRIQWGSEDSGDG